MLGEELPALRHEGEAARRDLVCREPPTLGVGEADRAAARLDQSCNCPQRSRLSRTISTKHGDDLARFDLKRYAFEDLKWAVEAVRIQQSTGGRLAPILHTLAAFMRTRQEVRREVQTLSAEGRMSGYVLFAIPLFLVFALEMKDPSYLDPMLHGAGLIVLIFTAGLMALGFWIVRRMVNIKV